MAIWISVDVEADGPIPGDYSMISLGAIVVQDDLKTAPTFYGRLRPISGQWIEQALAVSGHTRDETEAFPDAGDTIAEFAGWLDKLQASRPGERLMFVADNNGFDWMFVCWYLHHFLERNPFGHSSTNLNSIYKGMTRDMTKNCKRLRKTKHTHHPVDDARGNAEALLEMKRRGLIIGL